MELSAEFERHRRHLHAVAHRMLGTHSEADDAVQEAWLRVSRADTAGVDNPGGWLTTVVARVALDMLRTRRSRREVYVGNWPAESPLAAAPDADPEHEALTADSVGIALLVVLETLSPPERLAFVLHDLFGLPFEDIAPVVERTPVAARQLASRARRRVRGAALSGEADLAAQRRVVDAFLAASRGGDFEALLEVLDPGVVFRIDAGRIQTEVVGSGPVARRILARGSRLAPFAQPALVNGAAGVVVWDGATPTAVVGFSVRAGRIAAIDLITDPARLAAVAAED